MRPFLLVLEEELIANLSLNLISACKKTHDAIWKQQVIKVNQ